MKRIIDYIMVAVKGACMGAADVIPGVSGGTITSVGVADMLKNCLDDYTSFLTK